jgi:dynein heavy chain
MAKVQARLDEMQMQFDAAMAQKQLLEEDAAACQKKMDSAAALLHALAGVWRLFWLDQSATYWMMNGTCGDAHHQLTMSSAFLQQSL